MKKTTRVLSAALAVLLVPVCACIIYISGGSRGVDDQGNAREAAARAEIEYARAGFPFHEACYGERVEHMVRIEVVDIFS